MAKVETFADMAAKYGTHPEFKGCDGGGERCTRATVGLLQRRHVTVGRIDLIGKESNRLEEREAGELTREDSDQWLTTYEDRDGWYRIHLPQIRKIGLRQVALKTGMSERRTRDVLQGLSFPRLSHRAALLSLIGEEP
jgi:hypothetical protein